MESGISKNFQFYITGRLMVNEKNIWKLKAVWDYVLLLIINHK